MFAAKEPTKVYTTPTTPRGNGERWAATEKAKGYAHPGCFGQRVRKRMKRWEIAFCFVQKSTQEYENKGRLSGAEWHWCGHGCGLLRI